MNWDAIDAADGAANPSAEPTPRERSVLPEAISAAAWANLEDPAAIAAQRRATRKLTEAEEERKKQSQILAQQAMAMRIAHLKSQESLKSGESLAIGRLHATQRTAAADSLQVGFMDSKYCRSQREILE